MYSLVYNVSLLSVYLVFLGEGVPCHPLCCPLIGACGAYDHLRKGQNYSKNTQYEKK
jgi:hypothetical protein